MRKTNYSRKFPTNIKLSLFALLIFLLGAFIAINLLLSSLKQDISGLIARFIPATVKIGNIFYLPPDSIIVKEVDFNASAGQKDNTVFSIPALTLKFSFRKIFAQHSFIVNRIGIYGFQADYHRLSYYCRQNWEGIKKLISIIPQEDIKLTAKKTNIFLAQNKKLWLIDSSFTFEKKGDLLTCEGSSFIDEAKGLTNGQLSSPRTHSPPFNYSLQISYKPGHFSFTNLELKRENLYLKLWGDFAANTLKLNGFAFMKTLSKESGRKKNLSVSLRVFSAENKELPIKEAGSLPGADLYLLDINLAARLALPQVTIDRLSFSLNKNPAAIKGSVVFSSPFSLDLEYYYGIKSPARYPAHNIKDIKGHIKGSFGNAIIEASGIINIGLDLKKKDGLTPQELVLKYRGLNALIDRQVRVKIEGLEINYPMGRDLCVIPLKNFQAVCETGKINNCLLLYQAQYWDGLLKGMASIDTRFPFPISAKAELKGVSADNLKSVLIHFAKVHGKLSAELNFTNKNRIFTNGSMHIKNGFLENFDFFKWLADTFSIPGLRKINFSSASSDFYINELNCGLSNMDLEAPKLKLQGYFDLDNNDLVHSKILLSMDKQLLRESPKFIRLLNVLGKHAPDFQFNFQLSGYLERMNFLWLKSDFKEAIQSAIPGFVQRNIEREVEKTMQSIP